MNKDTTVYAVIGGDEVTIKGDIYADTPIEVRCGITGDICSDSIVKLVNATIEGNINATSVIVDESNVKGDIMGRDKVSLLRCANVTGNIHTASVFISETALFNGTCTTTRQTEESPKQVRSNAYDM